MRGVGEWIVQVYAFGIMHSRPGQQTKISVPFGGNGGSLRSEVGVTTETFLTLNRNKQESEQDAVQM